MDLVSQVDVKVQKAWLPSWMLDAKNSGEQGHHLNNNTVPFTKSHIETYIIQVLYCA